MLKIGEFSKLSRVSVRMLRYYDEIGLLKPAEIDRFTDYRYYREDQLPTVNRITALRDMGFSLAHIVRILAVYDDRRQLERFLSARQRELEDLSRDTTRRLTLLEADPCLCAVTFLDGEYKEENVELMAWKTVKGSYPDTEHVKFRTLPEVTVASCTYQGGYERIGDVYAAVAAWLAANGYEGAGPMFNIYHVSPHETQDPNEFVTEVCYPARKK